VKPSENIENRTIDSVALTHDAETLPTEQVTLRAKMMSYLKINVSRYSKQVIIILLLHLVLCFANTLERSDLYSVIIIIALYATNEKDKLPLLAFIWLLGISILLDIIWIDLHVKEFNFSVYEGGTDEITTFVIVITTIGILLKLIVLYPVVKLYQELPEVKPSDTTVVTQRLNAYFAFDVDKYCSYLGNVLMFQAVIYCLNSIGRTDCTVLPIAIGYYGVKLRDRYSLLTYIVFLDVSMLVDLIWLGIHINASIFTDATLIGTEDFTITLTLISLLIKLIAHYPAFKLFMGITPGDALATTKQQSQQQTAPQSGVVSKGEESDEEGVTLDKLKSSQHSTQEDVLANQIQSQNLVQTQGDNDPENWEQIH